MTVRPRILLGQVVRCLTLMILFGAALGSAVAVWNRPHKWILFDFRGGLYNAGAAILHGVSPYHPGFLAHQAAIMRAGGIAIGESTQHAFSIPVYPAPANLAMVPFALLPYWVAGLIYTVLSVAAMVLAVRLLGVRDWRCYAVALISWPFLYGIYLGAVGPFLVLGAAVAWRWRDRLWAPAIAIASIVAAKVFPWPLAAWLLITRRYRTFGLMVAIGTLVTFGAWAVIGFDGLLQYPQMLSELSFIQELRATSLVAVLLALGLSSNLAGAVAIAIGVGLLAGAWRIYKRPGGEPRAFGLAILAALTATPIVWEHYMVLLFIPIALMSPRLSWLWFTPLLSPVLVVASAAIFPLGNGLQTSGPDTLRPAAVWLAVQVIVGAKVALSGTETESLTSRLRSRLRRPAPPVSAAVELG